MRGRPPLRPFLRAARKHLSLAMLCARQFCRARRRTHRRTSRLADPERRSKRRLHRTVNRRQARTPARREGARSVRSQFLECALIGISSSTPARKRRFPGRPTLKRRMAPHVRCHSFCSARSNVNFSRTGCRWLRTAKASNRSTAIGGSRRAPNIFQGSAC